MNPHDNMHDDPAFDEYLKRDSMLSRQYQNSSTDEVPNELDQKILAQARAAIDNNKVVTHPSWWIKWNKPLALAATLMLAFTVVYRAGHQSIEQLAAPEAPVALKKNETSSAAGRHIAVRIANEPLSSDKPSAPALQNESKRESAFASARVKQDKETESAGKLDTPAAKVAAPVIAASPAPTRALVSQATTATAGASAATASSTPPADVRNQIESSDAEKAVVIDSTSAADIGKFPDTSVAESMQRIPGVSISRSTSSVQQLKKSALDPKQALQHIRDLRKQGKQQQADKAWQQFQKDFPDYPVAKDDAARSDAQ